MGVSLSDYHAMRERLEKSARGSSDRAKADLFHDPGAAALKAQNLGAAPGLALVPEGIRIRQDSGPRLNKIEQRWFDFLKATGTVENLSGQAIRFRLANGAWYKGDIAGWIAGRLCVWDTKGGKKMKGVAKAHLTMKVVAREWPQVQFFLVWEERGEWRQQLVLP